MESMADVVNLSSLTDKQLSKEFKTVGKEIKSKDPDVKTIALEKLKDSRYFTIGGCLVPLIESMIPKKKSYDANRVALDIFDSFVGQPSSSESLNAEDLQESLRNTVSRTGHLEVFRIIIDLAVYKEEAKLVKPKKGQPIEIPVENMTVVNLRLTSLKVLYGIVCSLSKPNFVDYDLCIAFACVKGLTETICAILISLKTRYLEEISRTGMLQEGTWALMILIFVLRNNESAMSVILSVQTISTLQLFAKEEPFSVCCLQLFELMSLDSGDAVEDYFDEEFVLVITSVVVKASEEPIDAIATGATIGAPVTASKKVPPAKKEKSSAKIDISPRAQLKLDSKLTHKQCLGCIKIGTKTLTAICNRKGSAITPGAIELLVQSISRVMLDSRAWDTARSLKTPLDVEISDTFDNCCILIGAVGLIDDSCRRLMYESGCIPLLLTAMQNSMRMFNCLPPRSSFTIERESSFASKKASKSGSNDMGLQGGTLTGIPIGSPKEEEEKMKKVKTLRRLAEKAVLSLVTSRSKLVNADGDNDPISLNGHRWNSVHSNYMTDLELFTQSENGDTSNRTPSFPSPQLIEIITSSTDVDLGNRGIRIMAALLEGITDSNIQLFGLDVTAFGKLSTAVQSRVTIVLEAIEASQVQYANQGLKAKKDSFKNDSTSPKRESSGFGGYEETKEGLDETEGQLEMLLQNAPQPQAIEPIIEDLLQLMDVEGLYLSLIIVEKMISITHHSINIFASRERLGLLASLLYKCGPVGNQNEMLLPNPNRPPVITPPQQEYEINLYDPRNYSWYPDNEDMLMYDKVLLRPIILDVLSIITSAEEKYRVYEGVIPLTPIPGAPLLAYTSPCKEAALSVVKICGDACISVLLSQAKFELQPEDTYPTPHMIETANSLVTLEISVLDAALGTLLAMTRCGAIGIYAILESVSEGGFNRKENTGSAVNLLKSFLNELTAAVVLGPAYIEGAIDQIEVDQIKASLIYAKSTWSRSLIFDQLFTTPIFDTHPYTMIRSPIYWPYVTICTAVLGVISNIKSTPHSVELAINIFTKLCQVDNLSTSSQPVVADSFGAFFLALGGGLTLAGALGRFGILPSIDDRYTGAHEQGVSFLGYLIGRGREREVYWLSRVPAAETDGKSTKGAAVKGKDKDKSGGRQSAGNKSAAKTEGSSIVQEVTWNLEADNSHSDPNHGPSRGFWKVLLEDLHDETHTLAHSSSLLSVAVQGGLSGVVQGLLVEQAGVNLSDSAGLTPLMYAVILADLHSVSGLIGAGADVDAIDNDGDPVIVHACHSITPDDLQETLSCPVGQAGDKHTVSILGNCSPLQFLLNAGIDVCVCGSSGDTPLLLALGLGTKSIIIGGYTLNFKNSSYTTKCSEDETLTVVESLLAVGALVNACNKRGVVPLHIAAARGHLALIDRLKNSGAIANAEDEGGYIPLHYVVATCPNKAPKIFDSLMEYSKNRPIQKMVFNDIRTGQSKAKKYEIDVAARMNKVFADSLRESNLRSLRLTEHDLLNILTPDKMNLLQLCMTSHILQLESFIPLLSGDKYERMLLAEHLINKVTDKSVFLGVDSRGMSVLHAASLLFQGSTPSRALTAQELRSKRVKTYPSLELKLLDNFFSIEGDLNSPCDRVIPPKGFPKKDPLQVVEEGNGGLPFPWTPMHGAIAGNNIDLLKTLIHEKKVDCTSYPYVHFLAESVASAEICDLLITACASSSSYNTLLNSTSEPYTAKPLHLATRTSNVILIEKLLKCSKVDPNVRDDTTGLTAIHEACIRGDLVAIEAFGRVSERLDLLVATDDGKTSIDTAINSRNFSMLEMLLIMRRNDVLERILHSRATENVSVLTQLELENILLAKSIGYFEKEITGICTVVLEENTSLIEPMNNLSITNESKISEPIDKSFPDSLCEDNEGMIRDEENTVEILQNYYYDKTADEASRISDQIVGILIKAVIEAGIVSEDFHAHICFSQGVSYKEHVTNCNKEENDCDMEENYCDIEENNCNIEEQ